MGEVYRARDTKLNRDVALKVLPELFAADADRLARFTREAQTLAALNHPNIAAIYGIENGALVMELVEGEDLSELIARGPIPLAEALPIARQIADALEAAHEPGIIHRDLKPANVKVRPDGTVKVLDFGLAKAMDPPSPEASAGKPGYAMNSPTLTAHATQMGMIIGTAAYMAPEQARGRAVDRRADIWAFGVVHNEMLTGRRAFAGDDISITLAAVLKDAVPMGDLPSGVPASVRRLLRRCLEKDPKQRLSSIGDARLELNETEDAAQGATATTGARASRASWPLLLASAAVGVVVTALVMAQVLKPDPPASAKRLTILPPDNASLMPDGSELKISPDGRRVAFVTGSPNAFDQAQLWVRTLAEPAVRLVQGATGAQMPFWSPDSKRIAFFAEGKLKTVPADGGRVDVLCDATDGRGGTWGASNVIVFAPSNAGPLMRVDATGGAPAPATSLDAARKETGHRFPFFLPDGRHFLFAALPAPQAQFDIFVGSLDGPTRTAVVSAGSAPVYTEPGFLLFARKGVLVAQPFDATRLTLSGNAITLDDVPGGVGYQFSSSPAATATADTLVYLTDPYANTRLVWVDREGREVGAVQAPPARHQEVRLSPDNQRAAVVRITSPTQSSIWVLDLVRHGANRIADGTGLDYQATWSADGTRIAYTNDGTGTEQLFARDTAAATPEVQLFQSPALFKKVQSWSKDGTLLFAALSPETQQDLVGVTTSGDPKAVPYLTERFNENLGRFSPDGRWVAYVSDEAGTNDVYVRSFPTPDRKHRVTTDGGTAVTWNAAGTQLLIVGSDGRQLKVADVKAGPALSIGIPKVVGALPADAIAWDASRDLQRLLVSMPARGSAGLSLTVVTNWTSALAKR